MWLWRNDTVCLMSCVLYRFFCCRLFIILVFTFLQRLVGIALYSPQCDFDSNVARS